MQRVGWFVAKKTAGSVTRTASPKWAKFPCEQWITIDGRL